MADDKNQVEVIGDIPIHNEIYQTLKIIHEETARICTFLGFGQDASSSSLICGISIISLF